MTLREFTVGCGGEAQVVMSNNRLTLHYPIDDFTGHRRLLLRCIALEPPT